MNTKPILIAIGSLVILSCVQRPPSFDTDELIGVWSGLLFQTESSYDSIVVHTSPVMKATLYKQGDKTIYPIVKKEGLITFKGTNGLRFDASLSNNDENLNGILTDNLWVQSLDFRKKEDRWISKIVKPEIIDTDYQVYLEFYRDSTGGIQANIQSNKENRKLHFVINEVNINGNQIKFKISNDRFKISARYMTEKNYISLDYGNSGGKRTIPLIKLKANALEGYLPRSLNEAYAYKVPEAPDSLLPAASLEDVNINRSLLQFMDKIDDGDYEHIHSILITKGGKLVLEEYFHGYDREYLHDIRSAFKSFASLTFGRAMKFDPELNTSSSITDYYPEYEIKDPQKSAVNIHHVLTMSTGIKLEDEDEMQWNHNDWVGYKLNLPMKYKPGEKYEYSSGGSNLLTGVIQKSTDRYLPLFIYDELLLPMGIDRFQMLTSPQWRGYLAGNFYLRPIDFTKFGLLVLNNGNWNGEQLISQSWIDDSTRPHIKGTWPKDSDYGYLWRLLQREVHGKTYKTIEAWGNGGQFLIVIPELEMTVTFTGGNYNMFPDMEKPLEILNNYILPAVILQEDTISSP